eukprot:CFRG3996T1
MIIFESYKDVDVNGSTMRIHVFEPGCEGSFPGLAVFTEIYQVTGPVERLCRLLASEGYVVGCPESYHEMEPPGTVIPYDGPGTDKGNAYKIAKTIEAFDMDAAATISYLKTHSKCNGRMGAIGMCLGGHLALRCAFEKEVIACVCFFATDIHCESLGSKGSNTLKRIQNKDLGDTEMLMIFGKQDNHVPYEGRRLIHDTMSNADCDFSYMEVNAAHAFIRDELSKGRYDASVTRACLTLALEIFQRRLIHGCPSARDMKPQASAPGPQHC